MLEEVLCLCAFVRKFHLKSITSLNTYGLSQLKTKGEKQKRERLPQLFPCLCLLTIAHKISRNPGEAKKKWSLDVILFQVSASSASFRTFSHRVQCRKIHRGPKTTLCLFLPCYCLMDGWLLSLNYFWLSGHLVSTMWQEFQDTKGLETR